MADKPVSIVTEAEILAKGKKRARHKPEIIIELPTFLYMAIVSPRFFNQDRNVTIIVLQVLSDAATLAREGRRIV